ncbi:MAG: RHS repeat-associated core domain-containing protein, partial [Verrucomicrobiota bacterium]
SIRKKDQPNGNTITKICDTLNRAIRIIGPGGLDTAPLYEYENNFDLYANVARIEESYPSTDSPLNDRTVVNTYDQINRLTDEAITTGAVTVSTVYGYDDAHNRTSKVLTRDDGTAVSTLENSSYVYSNSLNQITSYTDSVSGKNVSYTYDLNGNRATSQTDTDGDAITDHSTQYGYDYENRLLSHQKTEGSDVDTYAYGYDYRTRRTLRDESGADDANQIAGEKTYVVFSGGLSVQEWNDSDGLHPIDPASDSLEVEYVRGNDYGGGIGGILYTLRGIDASIKHYNSRGDVVAAVDGTGSLTYQAAYEAFGRHGDTSSSEEWGSTLDRQQANTKDEDPTGLLNEGFRYRDLETGTFTTRDPLGFVDGPNVYTYVVQNPWTKFDPLGLATGDIHKIPQITGSLEQIIAHTSGQLHSQHSNSMTNKNPGGNEHAVRIFKDSGTGQYSHGDVAELGPRKGDANLAPEPSSSASGMWEEVGKNHTHPFGIDADSGKPPEKQDVFSDVDKENTPLGQFTAVVEMDTKNVFKYNQISEFPEEAVDGNHPDFDPSKSV